MCFAFGFRLRCVLYILCHGLVRSLLNRIGRRNYFSGISLAIFTVGPFIYVFSISLAGVTAWEYSRE